MTIYHVETQQDYNALMVELEEKGRKWLGGAKPTQLDKFKNYGKDTYIFDESGVLSFSSGYYFIAYCSNETLIEYKAKRENILNIECKHCHEKWHHGNVKYCAMCGNKLVDEPDFKAGDIVSSEILPDGCGIVRLEEDLTCELSVIYGIWYTNNDCEIQEVAFTVFKEDTRHATQSEIEEYEVALTFHKHGRDPFEVKDGDLLDNVFGKYIAHEHSFSKEDFTVGGNTLLKTAEEVNEWLEK